MSKKLHNKSYFKIVNVRINKVEIITKNIKADLCFWAYFEHCNTQSVSSEVGLIRY